MDKASAYGAEDSRFDPWCGSPTFCENDDDTCEAKTPFVRMMMTPVKQKGGASTPGIEPGIFRSVGGRLIHWAMRNEAQEDFMQNWMHTCQFLRLYT